MGTSAAFLFALIVLPSGAFALDVRKCSTAADLMYPHEAEVDHERLGNGLVSYIRGGAVGEVAWNYFFFVNCKSGETIQAEVWRERGTESQPNHEEAVRAKVREIVASPEVYSFSDVRREIAAIGAEVELWTSNDEICACRAFYPSARGEKTPYVYRSLFVEPEPRPTGGDR